jgi:hypothetical protein
MTIPYRQQNDFPPPLAARATPVATQSGTVTLLIPDELRECAVSVYMNGRDGLHAMGTAIVMSRPVPGTRYHWYFIVTARHVVEQIRGYSTDGMVWIRATGAVEAMTGMVPLSVDEWWFHPNDTTMTGADFLDKSRGQSQDIAYDVAVALGRREIVLAPDVMRMGTEMGMTQEFIQQERVQPGDDVALSGMFSSHLGLKRNSPIVRGGMIAVMPEDPVHTPLGPMNAYLIEIRSVGGLSGSPVIWLSGQLRYGARPAGGLSAPPEYLPRHLVRLLGMVSGHYGKDPEAWETRETLNQGIAVVVPWTVIADTIDQERFVAERKQVEQRLASSSDVVLDSVADPSHGGDDERVSLEGVSPDDALRALLKTPPHGQTQDPA